MALGGLGSFLELAGDGRGGRALGIAVTFVGGAIYNSSATDPHESHGIVREAYINHGGGGGPLGLPDDRRAGVRGRPEPGLPARLDHVQRRHGALHRPPELTAAGYSSSGNP